MNRIAVFVIALVVTFFSFHCGKKAGSGKHAQADTVKKSVVDTAIRQGHVAAPVSKHIDFNSPFYVHYSGIYLGHKAYLDVTHLRNSVFFTLCYLPKYKVVSGVVEKDKQGFSYAYVNKFGDTLELWHVKFIDDSRLKLDVQTSVLDTTYIFNVDYSTSLPLEVVSFDTVLYMPHDTTKELLLISLSDMYNKSLKFNFLKDLPGLKKEAQDEIANLLQRIKSYSPQELETMFFPFNVDRLMNVEYNNNGLLVISSNQYVFMGGAHGSNILHFYNIDTKKKKLLSVTDVMDTTGLAKMIWNKLDNKDELFVDESNIYVPKNFFVKGRKIYFVYNVYEIAPYVVGSIGVEFDFSQVWNKLNHNFIKRFYPGFEL